jgi:hypothetical protein
MKDQLNRVSKKEDIQQITIHLPRLLAERAKKICQGKWQYSHGSGD